MQLSATPNTWRFIALSFATGILVHMSCVGLPIAWAAARAGYRPAGHSAGGRGFLGT